MSPCCSPHIPLPGTQHPEAACHIQAPAAVAAHIASTFRYFEAEAPAMVPPEPVYAT